MTEQQISALFTNYRCLKAEHAIMKICSEQLLENFGSDFNTKYRLLERKMAVIDQLSAILPHNEQFIVQKHLTEGLPWSGISEMIYADKESDLPYDKRSLQRIQAKALTRIHTFIQHHFNEALDFLTDGDL